MTYSEFFGPDLDSWIELSYFKEQPEIRKAIDENDIKWIFEDRLIITNKGMDKLVANGLATFGYELLNEKHITKLTKHTPRGSKVISESYVNVIGVAMFSIKGLKPMYRTVYEEPNPNDKNRLERYTVPGRYNGITQKVYPHDLYDDVYWTQDSIGLTMD